jgi:hypothetical protein
VSSYAREDSDDIQRVSSLMWDGRKRGLAGRKNRAAQTISGLPRNSHGRGADLLPKPGQLAATGAGTGLERRLNIRDDAVAICLRHMNRDAAHHKVFASRMISGRSCAFAVAVMIASGNLIFGGTVRLSLHRAIASLVMAWSI